MTTLLVEDIHDVQVVTEASNDPTNPSGKHLVLSGIFLSAEKKNRNHRVYPANVLEREVARYTRERIKTRTSYGELGHSAQPNVNLERVSHLVTELRREGNDWRGKARVIPAGLGTVVIGLHECGGALGMSSRGVGTLIEDPQRGCLRVGDDYHLSVAADIVDAPSADAWVHGILENVQWFWNAAKGEWAKQGVDDLRKKMRRMPRSQLNESKIELFRDYIARINRKPETTKPVVEAGDPLVAAMCRYPSRFSPW